MKRAPHILSDPFLIACETVRLVSPYAAGGALLVLDLLDLGWRVIFLVNVPGGAGGHCRDSPLALGFSATAAWAGRLVPKRGSHLVLLGGFLLLGYAALFAAFSLPEAGDTDPP